MDEVVGMGEEFAHWQSKFGFTDVNFQDETFFTKRSRVVGVAEEFLRRKLNVTWAGTMRADQGSRLSDEEVARFAVNRYRFPGVEIKARLFRSYPLGEVASHALGYIGRIRNGAPRM